MEESYDEELFIRPDGKPMVFCLLAERQCSEYRHDLVRAVELRGGVVLDRPGQDYNESSTIRLLGRYENHNKRERAEMYDYRYVSDCIQKNRILENMLDYRVSGVSLFQQYERYDPLDILHGYKTWSQIPRDEGDRVSDIDDDFETSSIVSSVMDRTRNSTMKTFKSPYNRRNQEEIVRALVRFAAYRLVRGNSIWKKLEGIGICDGIRTWQSMKEHFRKKIIHNIHDFGLTWRQVRRFRATYGLDEVRDSDVDSDEEEGVDNEANHRTQTPENSEKTFRPRRTSSPVMAAPPPPPPPTDPVLAPPLAQDSPGEQDDEEGQGEREREKEREKESRRESPRKRKKVRPEPQAEPEPSTSAEPVMETSPVSSNPRRTEDDAEAEAETETNPAESVTSNKISSKPSVNVVPSEPAESTSAPEKETESPPAAPKKRKRKLFSNNNSYLDDDGNSNNVKNTEIVSPSKKRRVLSTLDETQEEELVSTQKSAQMDIDAGKIPEVIMNDAIDHQDTLEEIFGPGVSPLNLAPAKRKSKLFSEESVSGSDTDKAKAGRNKETGSERRLTTVTKDKQGISTSEERAGPSQPVSPSSRKNQKNISADSSHSVQSEKEEINRRKSSGSIDSREGGGSPSGSGSDTNKENMNRSYWYQANHRTPFSRGEEETIVKYFLRNGGYSTKGGNTVWKKMEEDVVCPGRTWHSLKERFDKYIEPALHKFGVSRQRLLDRDKELNKSFGSEAGGKGMRKGYSKQEDLKIIHFIIENKRFADVKGNELWKLMEEREVVEGRTWQSLKERYRKIILKNINNYKLEKEVVAMFTAQSKTAVVTPPLRAHSPEMVKEFIEGWDLVQVLGEGTFGEVKLLVNKENGEACAMKEIDIRENPEAEESVKKEICVHKLLKHKQIVQCYGSRQDGSRQFIFLEYCSGGELFDRIEPDVGMPEHQAQRFFIQIMGGLEYLHKKGVSHRDIKPENLLLDENDCLKISDFGMATVFRHQGKERLLERRCGTMPYIAPEVLVRAQYNAEPADLWSCGVVLVAMLTGELPWDKPTSDQPEYCNWKDGKYSADPWRKIDNLPLSLLRKILMPLPSRRYKLEQILNHIWVKKKLKDGGLVRTHSVVGATKRLCGGPAKPEQMSFSQPADLDHEEDGEGGEVQEPAEVFHGFTQPAQLDDMLVSTQGATQSSQTSLQKLVKRMTRFWVSTDMENSEKELKQRLASLKYQSKVITPGIVTISTMDRRGGLLVFKATLIEMDKQVLMDFRLSRGDGIEFKRNFIKIKKTMESLIVKGPIMWSLAIHSNSLPGV